MKYQFMSQLVKSVSFQENLLYIDLFFLPSII